MAAGLSMGMRYRLRNRDTLKDCQSRQLARATGPALGSGRPGQKPAPATTCLPKEIHGFKLISRTGRSRTPGCHGNRFWSLRRESHRVWCPCGCLAWWGEGDAGVRAHSSSPDCCGLGLVPWVPASGVWLVKWQSGGTDGHLAAVRVPELKGCYQGCPEPPASSVRYPPSHLWP